MDIEPKNGIDAQRTDLPMGPALVERAKVFAYGAHAGAGQRRKYDDSPYILHPKAVAGIIASLPTHTDVMLALAWLHDVVEDTDVSMDLITAMFGFGIAHDIWFLTDPEDPEKNRATRKAESCVRLAAAPPHVQTVKLADLIDNTATIEERDPDFWKVYRLEKIELLKVLRAGDIGLWNRAAEQCGMDERRK